MASDSRCTVGNMITPAPERKMCRLSDGSLLAYAGRTTCFRELIEFLEDDEADPNRPPTWDAEDTDMVRVTPDGKMWTYEGRGGLWLLQRGPYVAIGSGSFYAYGAMAYGAGAEEAVKIGIKFDPFSGRPVRTLALKEKK